MNYDDKIKSVNDFFENLSQKEFCEMLYADDIKAYKEFDKSLWEDVIDNHIILDSDRLLYNLDPEKHKFEHIFKTFRGSVNNKLPWERIPFEGYFCAKLYIENNGNFSIVTKSEAGFGGYNYTVKPAPDENFVPNNFIFLDEMVELIESEANRLIEEINNAKSK